MSRVWQVCVSLHLPAVSQLFCWSGQQFLLTQSQDIFCSLVRKLGVLEKGTQPGWVTLRDQRDIPEHGSMFSVQSEEKKEEGEDIQADGVSYPSHCHLWWGPLSWRWVNTCLAMGSRELIPCSALLCLCVWLLLSLINFLYLNPQVLSLLLFQSSPQNQNALCSLHSIKTFPYSLALSSLEECRKQRDNEETWELNPKPITR